MILRITSVSVHDIRYVFAVIDIDGILLQGMRGPDLYHDIEDVLSPVNRGAASALGVKVK